MPQQVIPRELASEIVERIHKGQISEQALGAIFGAYPTQAAAMTKKDLPRQSRAAGGLSSGQAAGGMMRARAGMLEDEYARQREIRDEAAITGAIGDTLALGAAIYGGTVAKDLKRYDKATKDQREALKSLQRAQRAGVSDWYKAQSPDPSFPESPPLHELGVIQELGSKGPSPDPAGMSAEDYSVALERWAADPRMSPEDRRRYAATEMLGRHGDWREGGRFLPQPALYQDAPPPGVSPEHLAGYWDRAMARAPQAQFVYDPSGLGALSGPRGTPAVPASVLPIGSVGDTTADILARAEESSRMRKRESPEPQARSQERAMAPADRDVVEELKRQEIAAIQDKVWLDGFLQSLETALGGRYNYDD